ncbi:MAG: hypothetical protein GDA39_01145, partial [Hyphomonadaceae bacterium]|nr:hypothetical protein [Hyphomonadaceae bacterium]
MLAWDRQGREATGTLTVHVTGIGEPSPVVLGTYTHFDPPGLTVELGETAAATLIVGPDAQATRVECELGSFDRKTNTYTASVSEARLDRHLSHSPTAPIEGECKAYSYDAAGELIPHPVFAPWHGPLPGQARPYTLSVKIMHPGVDRTPPVVAFDPNKLTVRVGEAAALTLTATDNVGITRGPSVICGFGSFDMKTNTYTAPDTIASTRHAIIGGTVVAKDVCSASVHDAAGNWGEDVAFIAIVPGVGDTTPPVLAFSPNRLTAASGATVAVAFTATDNVGLARKPVVTCSRGSFAKNTYTAPAVSEDTDVECVARAYDAAGNKGVGRLRVSITTAPDTTPPVLTFSPNPMTVVSGATVAVAFTVTDNVGIARGGKGVRCSAGSFKVVNGTYTAPAVSEDTDVECVARAYDAAGN